MQSEWIAAWATLPWATRDEVMVAAQLLGARYGRPIVTGIGVAEDEDGWFIRVDFHGMIAGDTHLILRSPADMAQVDAEVARITESNKAEVVAELDRMHAAYAREQKREKRSVAAKAGWKHRRDAAKEGM